MTGRRTGIGGHALPGSATSAALRGEPRCAPRSGGAAERRRRTLARHVTVIVALAALASGLSGCAAAREEIGTVNGDCYLALPAALEAVHHHGRLEGVRLVSVPWLRVRAPRLFSAVGAGGTGAVCLVEFRGDFTAATVRRPFGHATGSVAIVELGFPAKRLFGTAVLTRAPFDFAHGRA